MPLPVSGFPALHTTGTFPELAVYNHGLRMDAVITALSHSGINRVVDLGCGDGALIKKILDSDLQLDIYVGVDEWRDPLDTALADAQLQDDRITFKMLK